MFTKLSTVFNIHGDEAEALKSFNTPPRAEYRQTTEPNGHHASRPSAWGAPGTGVTFRAELMQNRSRLLRSFSVKELLPGGRVTLNGIHGEFDRESFELVRCAA